jgi:hypothetical protein
MQPPEVRGKLDLYCFRGCWEGMGRAQSPTVPEGEEVALESLSYTASEVVGRDGSSPEPNHARRPTSGVAEVQLLVTGVPVRHPVNSHHPLADRQGHHSAGVTDSWSW